MPDDAAVVSIPRGASVAETGHILSGAGLLRDDFRFRLVARIMGVSARLPAGEFRLPTEKSPAQLLRALSAAIPVQHRVTIVEGSRIRDIAAILAEGGWCTEDEFLRLAGDADTLRSLGLQDVESAEGYLFPDTYYLTRSVTDAPGIIRMMTTHFQKVWTELEPSGDQRGKGKRTKHEIVILASLIEKEAGVSEEMPRIASVFFNRLRRGMPLQSDPTVIYGIPDFSGNLTRKDLRTPSPHNTYLLPALPAGPICNPGRAALEAALHPAQGNDLYFVSKNNGTHYFSKTLKEHNRAVWKYQKNR